jgi:CRISPR system Cascade subunit CasD
MANTLFLRMEGPLQSWGERAQWSVRDTASEPTKSGVVGLLGCALGLKEDAGLRQLSQQIKVGVRCDQPGVLLVDYHTVVGGVLSAEGKVKINAKTLLPETVVSWRHYLCDASFLVAIQAQPQIIASLAEVVQNPHWPFYLGRKSCPPARPVYGGVGDYPTLEAALSSQPLYRTGQSGEISLRGVIESSPGSGVRRRDEINSNSQRTFLPRYTRDVSLMVTISGEEEECTSHA